MFNFGASFKQAREAKGISLDQIATETRISTRFLSAIETEEFHLLPGGIFNRGFVRAYAEKVGLDPDQAVADYERLAEVRPTEGTPAPRPEPAKKHQRWYPIAGGALLLLIIVFYIVTRESGHTAQTASAPQPAATASSNSQPAPPVAQPPVPNPPVAVETPPAAPAPVPVPAQQPNPQAAQPPVVSTPSPTSQALTLELNAREETWVKVTTDGKSANAGEVLAPGTTRKFSAQNSIQLSIGNAAGLDMTLNGKPMKPIGKSGQVRTLQITPETAKNLVQ
jgi:cytoskeletal protein RodZ